MVIDAFWADLDGERIDFFGYLSGIHMQLGRERSTVDREWVCLGIFSNEDAGIEN